MTFANTPRARITEAKVLRYREKQAALGIRVRSIRVHDDDWPEVQRIAREGIERRKQETER